MLQQHQQESQDETRLQSYLDDLQKPMRTLGEAARQEWRSEAESHLRSIIAAHQELGATEAEAIQAALAQFGEPKRIGFRMRLATLRQEARQNPESQVTKQVMRCCAVFFIPALISFLISVLLYVYTDSLAAVWLARNVTGTIFLLGPVLSGWLLGGYLPWLRKETQRTRAVHGARGIARLWFGLTVIAITTTIELGLFGALLRILSDGGTPHLIATDFLPSLFWLPVTWGVASWRSRRLTAITTCAGDDIAPA